LARRDPDYSVNGFNRDGPGGAIPASIHDVARDAGVSVATVSRSFTVPDTVALATRERVLAAAAELRYEPSISSDLLGAGRY
jgi:DNA-binding LacI/PurR family transcriptional regulator